MQQNRTYKALRWQVFESGPYSIVPIRDDDKFLIMKWRNEQIKHLRQAKPLTREIQCLYFENVVSKLFEMYQPEQILFSYLDNGVCIGYGGLVHINWTDRNAEISFLMDTGIQEKFFSQHWSVFLSLIENVAFDDLNFRKVFTYAFDIRSNLYPVLERSGFLLEATLKDHCLIEGTFRNVLIHSKFNKEFKWNT